MSKLIFFSLALIYLLLLVTTGGFAVFMAIGANTPPPEELETISQLPPETQESFWMSLGVADEKSRKLSEIATNGFQIVLGAFIGFLSAVGASLVAPKSARTSEAKSEALPEPNLQAVTRPPSPTTQDEARSDSPQ
jgi:hypothetical protein